jgi:hypothetical protein
LTRPRPQPDKASKTDAPLSRSVGSFFGELWKAVTYNPSDPQPRKPDELATRKRVVDQHVQERTVNTPSGPVTLRRTTIDEVEYPPPAKGK